jgi:acetyltransferase-like isoleucine patch superfamily enzyme
MSEKRFGKVGNSDVAIGRFTYGVENLSVHQWGEGATLEIGSFCSIAHCVTIFLGGNHRVDWCTTFPFGHIFVDQLGGQQITGHPATKGNVTIGNDVWIAHSATVMSGVTIGNGAVIAAHALVTKDVADYEMVGGNPAKSIKFRFEPSIRDLLLELRWWDLPVEEIREMTQLLSVEPSVGLLTMMIQQFRKG